MVDGTTGVGVTGTAVETVLAVTQSNEILQNIQIVLACITFVVTILYTIWKWYRSAKKKDSKGGEKITEEEVDDLFEDLKKEVDKYDRD